MVSRQVPAVPQWGSAEGGVRRDEALVTQLRGVIVKQAASKFVLPGELLSSCLYLTRTTPPTPTHGPLTFLPGLTCLTSGSQALTSQEPQVQRV